ncbi:MAG TPA: sodium-dependent transporter [Thermoanaerobaculia bacterium]|nr:sodium-dependent transporter [Thermoanaerobaculia bacterium]
MAERWGSRIGLVLAVAGSAVGLGNFLRFPAEAVQNGGGAFLLPYLVSFVLLGLPLLWVEWAIGRHGGQRGLHSAPELLAALGPQRWLQYLGVFGLFIQVTVAGFYCYVESWTLAYAWHSLAGTFRDTPAADFFPRYLGVAEGSIFALPGEALVFFALTVALNVWVLSRGLAGGIELVAKVGLPLLFVFAVVLAVRGLTLEVGDPGVVASPLAGLDFVWRPDLSGLANPTTWLAAAGQVFFTLSVGVGAIACYSSYLGRDDDLALSSTTAAWINELAEVVLGSAILIPIATAYLGLAAVRQATTGGDGFALGFLTLPSLFGNWGAFAPVAGLLWFGLLFLAGITSSLSFGQPVMAFLGDRFRMRRGPAAAVFGVVSGGLGFFCVWLFPGGAFDELNFWAGTFCLVLFAGVEAFVFAFVFGVDRGWEELTRGAELAIPRVFRFVLRWVTPPFILLVFVTAVVKPEAGDWGAAFASLAAGDGWPLAADSVVGKLLHVGVEDGWFDAAGAPTRRLVQDATRLLLLAVFVTLVVLVGRSWRRRGAPEPGRPAGGAEEPE